MAMRTIAFVTAIIYNDETGVAGFVEEIVGISARGKTEKDVRNRLRKAVEEFYQDNLPAFAQRQETYICVRRERLPVEIEIPAIDR